MSIKQLKNTFRHRTTKLESSSSRPYQTALSTTQSPKVLYPKVPDSQVEVPRMRKMHLPIIVEVDEDEVYIVSCPVFKGFQQWKHLIPLNTIHWQANHH